MKTITPTNNIEYLNWLIRFSGLILVKAKDTEFFTSARDLNIELATIYRNYVSIEH